MRLEEDIKQDDYNAAIVSDLLNVIGDIMVENEVHKDGKKEEQYLHSKKHG
jgi:hypothetical protein